MALRRLLERRFFFLTYPDKESFLFHGEQNKLVRTRTQEINLFLFFQLNVDWHDYSVAWFH